MALQKQNVNINFSSGVDTKTDPFQLPVGKFLSLENSVFDTSGRLTKRNGFPALTTLPDSSTRFLSTFNGNLTAIGDSLQAYSAGSNMWIDKGELKPVKLDTLAIIKNNLNQSYSDTAVAFNGLACTAYTDDELSGPVYKYTITDSHTGQNIIPPTVLVNADPTYGTPKVFILGNYFIIVYSVDVTGTKHLKYIAIVITNPSSVSALTDLTAQYTPKTTQAFDGYVANNNLYLAWNASDLGGAVRLKYLTSTLGQSNEVSFSTQVATHMSVTADTSGSLPTIYASYYDSVSQDGYTLAIASTLATVLAPTQIINNKAVANITSVASNGSVDVYYEITNAYGYNPSIPTNYIETVNVTQGGTVSSPVVTVRSVGLASKAFSIESINYFLAVYFSNYQPSYFLINENGKVVTKVAYSNGGPYLTTGLPGVTLSSTTAQISYLFKDTLQSINRTQGSTQPPVYSALGINLATFDFDPNQTTSEIGQNLNLSGGFLWAYDGFEPTENGFFVWPDDINLTYSGGTGGIGVGDYFYQVTYEWTDNQGNLFRSAPSLPVTVNVAAPSGQVFIDVPTLRLTYKITNPVKIVVYRWSTAQQIYYQVSSITQPDLNDTAVDSIQISDVLPDSAILGNNILYTTGGVLENISAPATDLLTLFDNRLWLVDSEDRNLLWFSKKVIQSTPVEMSDLLTYYVAPTTASEGSTGPITAIAPLDDKIIIFKENAMGYINGVGPDNTGANNGYSEFTLITSAVGSQNQQSIVVMPKGLMFESNKGIWLLGRDLSTQYIGAPVQSLTTGASVLSAVSVPGTNQIRFNMSTGIVLMYDYYYDQWGIFTNIPAISSIIYNDLHTYVSSAGKVFQESIGAYLDNTSPVLMSFTTGWLNLAGLQGYERFYQMYLLGQYLSPFKLNVELAYDYNESSRQATIVRPDFPGGPWGDDALWGSGQSWGFSGVGGSGNGSVFEARIFPQIQKCESFRVKITEVFDSSLGQSPGAGLTLSGLNIVAGIKKGYRTSSAGRSFG